jgi:hypothetical protein
MTTAVLNENNKQNLGINGPNKKLRATLTKYKSGFASNESLMNSNFLTDEERKTGN